MARKDTTRRGALTLLAATSLATALPASRSRAQSKSVRSVDLHLALAVDASGSVSQLRFDLQRRGYVDAFANPRVLQAIRSGPQAAIAVSMYQWTGPGLQALVMPWRLVDGEASIRAVASEIAAGPRRLFGGGTSVSGAIDHGVALFGQSPFEGGRRVIDVSGDGANNRGRPSEVARDEAVARGININGLPILEVEPDLEEVYRNDVVGGPGAFVIAAETFEDFGNAILRKLILEIAAAPFEGIASA